MLVYYSIVSMQNRSNSFLVHDVLIILFSISLALFLVQTEVVLRILASAQELELLGSFIAGLFFTSIFTTAPAIVTLGEIARINALVPTAALGALGALIGDLIIFRFVRDRFAEHISALASHSHLIKRIELFFRLRLFRLFSFFVGGLIIASPLPDELGIGLFGFSKMKMLWFIPLSFVFNFIGIVLIGLVARTI